jgi:hypothetical protein
MPRFSSVQVELGRLCWRGRSLVPLVKTRDFGMTPEGFPAHWQLSVNLRSSPPFQPAPLVGRWVKYT